MSTPIDPEFESEILAGIREPLLAAIAGADTRATARTCSYRLLAAACVCVFIAGGAVAVWRANRAGDTRPQVRVAPTTTSPETTTTLPAVAAACHGTALSAARSGASPTAGSLTWYLDLRNDSRRPCAVPFPTSATATDDAGRRVGLAGIDHTVGLGPVVASDGISRLVFEVASKCARTTRPPSRHYRFLVVTVGGTPIAAPGIELMLCTQGIGAVRFETAPPLPQPASTEPSDPTGVDVGAGVGIGGTNIIQLRNIPRRVGSGIGNGLTETPDARFLAYEYGSAVVHDIAIVDTHACAKNPCVETVLGHGHSPVFSSDGTLAYIALDDVPPASTTEAMWNRAGSVIVRKPDGTAQVWAHGTGMQTVGWAGDTLLVEHDDPAADTEGYEDLWLYRRPGERTALTQGLVAVSPDGTKLLLAPTTTDQMLELYDVASQRVVSSISIADYERALVPARELVGVDLTKWPGFEEPNQWPISCCESFTGATLWHDDLVLFPTTSRVTHRTNGEPDRTEPRPTLIRIVRDRIVPLRALQVVGISNNYDAARWVPGSTTEFVLRRSDQSPPLLVHCLLDGSKADCTENPAMETVFRLPATIP